MQLIFNYCLLLPFFDHLQERVMDCGSWANEGFKQLLHLYEICIAPINDQLPDSKDGEIPRITIIPHGMLIK